MALIPVTFSSRWRRQVGALLLLSSGVRLPAQSVAPERAQAAERGSWQVGAYVGAGTNSPNDGVLGTIPHRDHFMLALQAGTPVLRLGAVRVSYVAQLLPVFVVRDRGAAAFNPTLQASGIATLPTYSYAVGIAPFGLEFSSPMTRRVSAFLQSAGGGLVFSRVFPDVTGRRTNFTLEAGGGVRVRLGAARWAHVGYKYHHISNAGTAFANPGLDGNVVYAGYQWTARLPK
jgi:hypothetical protein